MSMRIIDIVAMSSVSFLSALDFKSFFTDESEFSHEKKKILSWLAWLYTVLFLVLFFNRNLFRRRVLSFTIQKK